MKISTALLFFTAVASNGLTFVESEQESTKIRDGRRLGKGGSGKGGSSGSGSDNTIAGAVGKAPFAILGKALELTGLLTIAAGPGPFTVFAPTDAAFKSLGDDALACLTKDDPTLRSLLTAILKYHATSATLLSRDVAALPTIQTLVSDGNSGEVTVTNNNTGIFIDSSQVVDPDNSFVNGVIHGIDAVLTKGPFDLTLLDPCINETSTVTTGKGGKGKGKGK